MRSRSVALLLVLAALVALVVLARLAGDSDGGAPLAPELENDAATETEGTELPRAREGSEPRVPAGRSTAATGSADGIEIAGTLVVPAGTPADERALAVLQVVEPRKKSTFRESWREVDRSAVRANGSFRLSLPEDAPKARVDVEGRYLFLDRPVPITDPRATGPVRLEPALGGVLLLRLSISPDSVHEARDLVGEELLVFHLPLNASSAGPPPTIRGSIGEDLTVELFGLDPADVYDVDGHLAGFAPPGHHGIRVRPGERTEAVIELVDGRVIGGMVVDEAGHPLEGAHLSIRCSYGSEGDRGSSTYFAWSDAEGRFLRTEVYPVVHSIDARLDGYLDGWLTAEEIGTELERRDLRVVLGGGRSIEGFVRLADGRPVAGAEVHCRRAHREAKYLGGPSFETDDAGRFRATGLSVGHYALDGRARFDEAALAPEQTPVRALAREREGVEWTAAPRRAPDGTKGLELRLVAPPGLEGIVVDIAGAPVREFRVEAESAGEARRSRWDSGILDADHGKRFQSPDGRFRWDELPVGEWWVGVRATGYLPAPPVTTRLPRDGAPLRFVLRPGGTVEGIVRDPAGRPLPGARVTPSRITGRGRSTNWNQSRDSDEEGRFHLTWLGRSEYELIARSDGFAPSVPVVVDLTSEPGASDVELWLTAGGTFLIDVLDPAGAPEPFAGVSVSGSVMQGGTSGETDREGHLELGPLLAGEYQVSARGEGEGKELLFGKARVVDGETVQVTLGGPKRVAVVVKGRVTAGGKPVVGALVHARPTEHFDADETIETGTDGRFSLGLSGGGHVLFRVYGEGRGRYLTFEEKIPSQGTSEVAFDLPTGGLCGTVSREGGGEFPFRLQVTVERVREEGTAWAGGDLDVLRVGMSGRWSCLHLEPGHYRIVAAEEPEMGSSDEYPVAPAVIEDIIVEAGRVIEGVDLVLGASGTIEGTVRGHDGRSIAEAHLCVRDSRGRLFHPKCPGVGAGGTFSLTGLPAGHVTVEAFGEHLATPAPTPVEVKPGEVVRQDLELVPATQVTVELGGWEGETSGVVVRLRDDEGREHTGERGRGAGQLHAPHLLARRFGPLPPGRWLVGATLPDGREVEVPFELAGERERTVVLECGE